MEYYNDGLKQYMKRVGDMPTFTREEQQELALTVQAGRQAAELLPAAKTAAKKRVLQKTVDDGANARNAMVEGNLKLVINQAYKFFGDGLSLDELVNEGNVALIVAVENFDPTSGNAFSSYAVKVIKNHLIRIIKKNNSTVSMSENAGYDKHRVTKVEKKFEQEYMRPPTFEEISELTGFSVNKIALLKTSTSTGTSLNSSNGNGIEIADITSVSDDDLHIGISETLYSLLVTIPESHRNVIKSLYGFNTGNTESHAEVSKENNMSHNRLGTVKAEAIAMLKHPSRHNLIKELFN